MLSQMIINPTPSLP